MIFFVACGYKPSAKYARNLLGKKISTSVVVSVTDPENSVLVKDALNSAVIDTFHASLVSRAQSDSHLEISISAPTYSPIQYDKNGFVVAYRMRVNLYIKRFKNGSIKTYKVSGFYDFAVEPNAVVTDQQRFDAIKNAAAKALAAFVSKVSAEGARRK